MSETVIRRHFMLEMRVDLSCVDTPALTRLAGRLDDLGLTVSTLEQEKAADPEAVGQAYRCHMACRLWQPPTELRREPIPFPRWYENLVIGPDALPSFCFLAKHREDFVGVCLLDRVAGQPDALRSGFTGTLPNWSQKGVAKALKAHTLLHIARQGYLSVETSNLQVNHSMCAINQSLGFQIVKRYLHTYSIPVIKRN